ncbi:MAG TPA: aspartate--tRNA(Asn) ligase [Lachnospiraceae bacterium]|nr:aspartate--tRNA(Asn) ligase [Lachnospiraceae bacterium]
METVSGKRNYADLEIADMMEKNDGDTVKTHGMIYSVKDMGDFGFVTLRKRNGLVQCVYNKGISQFEISDLGPEYSISVEGTIKKDERAIGGFEIHLVNVEVLSAPQEAPAINLSKRKLGVTIEKNIELRPLTLRNNRERAIFKMQEGVVRGFRDYLFKEGFTEIRTPKIVATGAEGGANIFKLDYFGKKAFLAQSPQFYKQMLVGVYERVFEVAPVFRAEKHNTTRHLNEYIGLDFEMGFISDFREIMEMETGAIKNMIELLKSEYERELKILNLELPEVTEIPTVRFKDAKEMVATEYGRKIKDPYDLEPEEEQLISKLFKEKYNSDFVFVTHYPVKKRPFYAMDDPCDPKYTLSFDLLFRGMEITTGGQRIHNYDDQVAKMISKGLDPADFEGYLMIHKYGMPPHGGLGMGLERLCMKLLDESNVRVASMFPRDMSRLTP